MTPSVPHLVVKGAMDRCPRCGERLRDLGRRNDRRHGPFRLRGGETPVVECPYGCLLVDVPAAQRERDRAHRALKFVRSRFQKGLEVDMAEASVRLAEEALTGATALVAQTTEALEAFGGEGGPHE